MTVRIVGECRQGWAAEPDSGYSEANYALRNAAILDSGATIHIFNNAQRFSNYRKALRGDAITAGEGQMRVEGYGEVDLELKQPCGIRSVMKLRNVAHCPGFQTNVVSLDHLHKQGIHWDDRPAVNCLRRLRDGSIVCQLSGLCRQFVLEYLSPTETDAAMATRRNRFNSWTSRPPSKEDGNTWHHRLGHPGPEALYQTIKATVGGKIRGPTLVECDECAKAKMVKQNRRAPRKVDDPRPGVRIGLDLHDFKFHGKGKMRHLLLLTDRCSGYH